MRSRTLKIWAYLIPLLIIPAPFIASQAEDIAPPVEAAVYSLGQQTLALSAGPFIPLFLLPFEGEATNTNISLGVVGSLQWGTHLDNHWLLGAEISGMFCQSLQKNILYMLPITIKVSYIFHIYPFEFPLFLGAGVNIIKYIDQTQLNLILKPGFTSLWKYNISWAFGLNVVYWWVLQPWKSDTEKSFMGNFLEATLTAQYSF